MNASKNRDVKITKNYRNLKPIEGIKEDCCIVNVRASVGGALCDCDADDPGSSAVSNSQQLAHVRV